jgi:hypothetical protein
MKGIFVVFIVVIGGLLFIQSCEVQSFNGSWIKSNSLSDSVIFKEPLRFYDPNTRLQYSIFNDSVNIYCYIKATEKLAQLKIIRTGILLKIDTLGKKKYQKTILYPLIPKKTNKALPILKETDWDLFISRFTYDHSYMKTTGFTTSTIEDEPIINNNGISVSITWDRYAVLLYKAIIPISQIVSLNTNLKDSTRLIGFSFYLKNLVDIEKEKQQNASNSTANSSYTEKSMNRNKPSGGNFQSLPQDEQQTYLFNIRSFEFNYKLAVKPK